MCYLRDAPDMPGIAVRITLNAGPVGSDAILAGEPVRIEFNSGANAIFESGFWVPNGRAIELYDKRYIATVLDVLASGDDTLSVSISRSGSETVVNVFDVSLYSDAFIVLNEHAADWAPEAPETTPTDVPVQGEGCMGSDYPNADWSGQRIWITTFQGANLSCVNMSDADMWYVGLSDTMLIDVDFLAANLANANLTSANLTDANLTNANFADADLTGATLTGAVRCNTTMPDGSVDSSGCRCSGQSPRHDSPCRRNDRNDSARLRSSAMIKYQGPRTNRLW